MTHVVTTPINDNDTAFYSTALDALAAAKEAYIEYHGHDYPTPEQFSIALGCYGEATVYAASFQAPGEVTTHTLMATGSEAVKLFKDTTKLKANFDWYDSAWIVKIE